MTNKTIKAPKKNIKIDNPFDTQYFRTKFMILNKKQHNESKGISVKKSVSHSKRSSALEKDFAELKKKNVFIDFRNRESEPGNTCSETLTHRGLELKELDIEENKMRFRQEKMEPLSHFGGMFDEPESDMTQSTKELLAEATFKIQKQKDHTHDLLVQYDEVELKWNDIKHTILDKKLIFDIDLDHKDEYSSLLCMVKESPVVYCESANREPRTVKSTPKVEVNHESVDRLTYSVDGHREDTDLSITIIKPKFFIDPADYSKDDDKICSPNDMAHKFFINNSFSSADCLKQWADKFKKFNKSENQIHFSDLIGSYIYLKMNNQTQKLMFENFLLYSRYDSECFNEKVAHHVLNVIKNVKTNDHYHSNISFLLFILSKICSTSPLHFQLFEISFQVCLYLLDHYNDQMSTSFNYCGIVYEYCSIDAKYCPEVIHLFKKIGENLPSDPCLVAKILKLIHKFMIIWKYISNFSTIFEFLVPLINIQEISDISTQIMELFNNIPKQNFNYNFLIKKTQALRQYDPVIEEIKPTSTKASDKIKGLKKLKEREYRGAKRELRRDSEYCAARQLKEIIKNDEDRHKRVKQLYKDISAEN